MTQRCYPIDDLEKGISTLNLFFVMSSIGEKYFTSVGLKNIILTIALRLLILKGYPHRIILFNNTLKGLGGKSSPLATNSFFPFSSLKFISKFYLKS